MAKQKGILRLKGTLDGITFYLLGGKYVARRKRSVSRSRILNDPEFQRTRENSFEFGRACTAGKVLRSAFAAVVKPIADTLVVGRLHRDMLKVIKSDPIHERGDRVASAGNLGLLRGFEFNI